jgi:hypothetical protein
MIEMVASNNFIGRDDTLYIKLPELKSFEELSKFANDLKKSIELPITNQTINGEVDIVGADQGSVVLYVTLGSIAAVELIAKICWSAALIRQKNAETKLYEAHTKTLDLKNESIELFVDAQKQLLKKVLQNEAEAISQKAFNGQDQHTIDLLKLSIATISDLIEKGAKILPMSNNEAMQKSFPDYDAPNLITSSIKQIKDSES